MPAGKWIIFFIELLNTLKVRNLAIREIWKLKLI